MRIILLSFLLFLSSSLYSQSIRQLLKEVEKSYLSKNYEKALHSALQADTLYQEEFGIESSEYSYLLSRIGSVYHAMELYDKAEEYYKKSIENFREYVDFNDDPDYVFTLNEYAGMLVYIEHYADAEPLLSESMEIEKEINGEQSGEYAYSLATLGTLQLSTGNYKEAESNLLKAIHIWKKKEGGYESEYANAIYSLADLYYEKDEYKSALPLYIDVVKKYKKVWGEFDQAYAISLADLGDIYSELSDFDAAMAAYQKAIEIITESVGEKNEDYADCINRIANLYRDKGDFDNSEIFYKKALAVQDENGFNNEDTMFGLSALYQIMGNFQASEKLITDVLTQSEKKGKESIDYIATQNLLANHFTLIGSYDKALALYKDIIEKTRLRSGEENTSYATFLDNLANLYKNMNEYRLAEQAAQKAMEIKTEIYGEFSPEVAYSLDNLASAYEYLGDYDKAGLYYKRIADIYLKTYGEDNYEYAGALSDMAYFNMADEKYQEAEELYNKAINIIEKQFGENHPMYANLLTGLCEIYELTGRSGSAEPLWLKINSNINNQIVQNFSFLAEKEKEEFISKISSVFEQMNSFIFRRKESNPSITAISYNNELALKGIVLQSSKAIRQVALNSDDKGLIQLYDTYFRNRQLMAKLSLVSVDQQWLNSDSLEKLCFNEEKELSKRIRQLNGSSDLSGIDDQITWKEVLNNLGPKDAAVEYLSFYYYNSEESADSSTYYCALVLRPGMTEPQMVFLFKETDLIKLLEETKTPNDATTAARLYKLPSSKDPQGTYTENALYKLVWKPIENQFQGVDKIYYSPAGLLNRISFDAIPVDDHSYLSDKYIMIAVSTTRSIVSKQKDIPDIRIGTEPVIYGGINYDSDTLTMKTAATRYVVKNRSQSIRSLPGNKNRGGSFSYLDGTLNEAIKINGILNAMKVNTIAITGDDATEESFKALNNLMSPPFIHIATHGFFFPEPSKKKPATEIPKSSSSDPFRSSVNPLTRSGLIFAGANHAWNNQTVPAGVEDGILLASEVSEMYLPDTRLVVLSACETGLGDIKGSEGVFGLQRAFKMAGVRYLLMSLWQVPDYQTAELMSKFYENWLSGTPIHDSFRKAQTFLKTKYPGDPFNWAAFVLVE